MTVGIVYNCASTLDPPLLRGGRGCVKKLRIKNAELKLRAAAVTARDEAVATEPRGYVAPNRYASLGVKHIEHCVFC
jgi:hypothetical protein